MKCAFIWDMDGTLVDSYPAIVPAVQQVCQSHVLDYSASAIHEFVIRSSVGEFFSEIGKTHVLNPVPLIEEFNTLNNTCIEDIQAEPHARDTLAAITENGHSNFIFTHRGTSTYPILKQTKLLPYFSEILTIQDGFPRKPAPDALHFLIRKHGLSSRQCYYVGDRRIDVEAAENAGIGSILYLPPWSLGKASGRESYIVSDLLEICQIFQCPAHETRKPARGKEHEIG